MDKRKEKIITIAGNLFALYGLKKTTLVDIAKEANMAKATLYYYFKNKQDIFAEVIKKESLILSNELEKAIDKTNDPKEKIENYILTRMKHLRKLTNYYRTITDEYLEYTLFVDYVRKDFIEKEIQTLIEILEYGVNRNDFQVKELHSTAVAITYMLKGLEFPVLIKKTSKNIVKESNNMIEIIINGIGKK